MLALGLLAWGTRVQLAIAQSSSPPQAAAPNFAELVAQVALAVVRVTVVAQRQAQPAEIPPELRGRPMEEFFRRFGGQGPGPQQPARAWARVPASSSMRAASS